MKLDTTMAVVTGGASGLGEATARHFAAQGAKVTLLDRDADRGTDIASEIGGHFAETDVTDEASVAAAIDLARNRMGGLNAAVNCAGIAVGIKTVGRDGPHPFPPSRKQSTSIWLAVSTSRVWQRRRWPKTNPNPMVRVG